VGVAEDLNAGDKTREGHTLPVSIRDGAGQGRKRHDPGDERSDGDLHGAPEHQASALNPFDMSRLAPWDESCKSGCRIARPSFSELKVNANAVYGNVKAILPCKIRSCYLFI
jgi:hypothetical protein